MSALPKTVFVVPVQQSTCHLLLARNLVAHAVVLFLHVLNLLLQVLHITILGSELVLKLANLPSAALNVLERRSLLSTSFALVGLELLLEAKDIEDHNVGTVEDERKEKGETTKVHVALGVKLAGLNLHSLNATEASLSTNYVSQRLIV